MIHSVLGPAELKKLRIVIFALAKDWVWTPGVFIFQLVLHFCTFVFSFQSIIFFEMTRTMTMSSSRQSQWLQLNSTCISPGLEVPVKRMSWIYQTERSLQARDSCNNGQCIVVQQAMARNVLKNTGKSKAWFIQDLHYADNNIEKKGSKLVGVIKLWAILTSF